MLSRSRCPQWGARGRALPLPAGRPRGLRLLWQEIAGNVVRGHAFYRCKVSADYPVLVHHHPRSLAVREDRLLPHVDAWLRELCAPERLEETASEIVRADARGHRKDPAVTRA